MTAEAVPVLPKHTVYDYAIDFQEGGTPRWGPIYALNETELEELQMKQKQKKRMQQKQKRMQQKKMTDMGVVRPSKSSFLQCSLCQRATAADCAFASIMEESTKSTIPNLNPDGQDDVTVGYDEDWKHGTGSMFPVPAPR